MWSESVSSATYASTIAPQSYYYFDSLHTTYLYYDGLSVYLFVNGALLDTWTYSQSVRNLTYSGDQITYNGNDLTYKY
jgi:hypothetical protein